MTNLRIFSVALAALATSFATSACSDDGDSTTPPGKPANSAKPSNSTKPSPTSDEDAGGSPQTDAGGTTNGCPDVEDREIVNVDPEAGITKNTTWTCDKLYRLSGLTYVENDSQLTLKPGTVVQGVDGSALIITVGSKISALGTPEEPIVLTSAFTKEPHPGDWGGLVLLGKAPLNFTGGTGHIEGIAEDETRGSYGSTTPEADWDCGQLKYVRVEFAGFELSQGKELNGISIGACGSKTTLEYVQVHAGSDDGIELWGGSARLSHIVLTGNQDDSLDWDAGWIGTAQFLAVQHHSKGPFSSDSNGFEGDNLNMAEDLMPRSNPTIYNATIIGGGVDDADVPVGDLYGMTLRRGTAATIKNSIITNFAKGAINVGGKTSAGLAADGDLVVSNSIFFGNLNGDDDQFAEEIDAKDDDGAFIEGDFFSDALDNVFDTDPELGDPTNTTKPDFVPAKGSIAAEGAATTPSSLDDADYIGAFEPGGKDWTEGWTAYPVPN